MQEWIAAQKNYAMTTTRRIVSCQSQWMESDKESMFERLLKRDNWIAANLDNVCQFKTSIATITDTITQPEVDRWETPIIIDVLHQSWFSSPHAIGLRSETKDYFLPLSEKLILFTCTMIRWAILNERDSAKTGTLIKSRFEGDQIERV
jgi:hypothetical protein